MINFDPPAISFEPEPERPKANSNSVLKIQLDKPEPAPEETHKPVDVSKLMPIYRGGGLACGGCGRGIVGRVVSAMGVRWHPACFKCSICSELLEHVSAYEFEGRPFCHLDYHEVRSYPIVSLHFHHHPRISRRGVITVKRPSPMNNS
jgi:hypothetical protein